VLWSAPVLHRFGIATLLLGPACLIENPSWDGEAALTSDTGTTSAPGDSGAEDAPEVDWAGTSCEALAPPAAAARFDIDPSRAADLDELLANAGSGAVFMLADGVYDRAGQPTIGIKVPGVSLRSASGNASAVVIDGGGDATDLLTILADDVTIGELTLRGSATRLIAVGGAAATILRPTLHDLRLQDAGGPKLEVLADFEQSAFVDDGVVSCSVFSTSDRAREAQASCDQATAIAAQAAAGWVVRDNLFVGHWCPQAAAHAAVQLRAGASDTVIERNVFRDNYRSLVLGSDPGMDPSVRPDADGGCIEGSTHFGGVVRNNLLWVGGEGLSLSTPGPTAADSMIAVWSACGVAVQHNTLVNLFPIAAGIEHRFATTSGAINNNLLTDVIVSRDSSTTIVLGGNVSGASPSFFAGVGRADLHVVEGAVAVVDRGLPSLMPPVVVDFEGQPRDALPDVGADELVP
jgi:hypothetical protein